MKVKKGSRFFCQSFLQFVGSYPNFSTVILFSNFVAVNFIVAFILWSRSLFDPVIDNAMIWVKGGQKDFVIFLVILFIEFHS